MKKSITVHISGFIFHIDDDAYQMLQNYIDLLRNKFSAEPDGHEILADIEARMAELLQQCLSSEKEVITILDVEKAKATLGTLEDFEIESGNEATYSHEESDKNASKVIFRNPDDKYIAGVCGGLASYFGLNPLYVRIAFLVLTLFMATGLAIYLLVWFILPEAQTTAEKLRMSGKPITIGTIKKSIKNEYTHVKNNFSTLRSSGKLEEFENSLRDSGAWLGSKLGKLGTILSILIGSVFVLIGVAGLLALTVSTLLGLSTTGWIQSNTDIVPVFKLLTFITTPYMITWISLSLFTVLLFPFITTIYGGLRMIFQLPSTHRVIGITSGAVWFLALASLIYSVSSTVMEFQAEVDNTKMYELRSFDSDTITISSAQLELAITASDSFDADMGAVKIDNFKAPKLFGQPRLNIQKSETNQCKLEITTRARGISQSNADELVQRVSYAWQQQGNAILFESLYAIPEQDKWRAQSIQATLYIPVGKIIYLDSSSADVIYDIQNVQNMWDNDMIGLYWQMTPDGLSVLNDANPIQSTDSLINETENTETSSDTTLNDLKKELEEMVK